MSKDTCQLLYELEPTLLTALPNTDSTKIKIRSEEIIQIMKFRRKHRKILRMIYKKN